MLFWAAVSTVFPCLFCVFVALTPRHLAAATHSVVSAYRLGVSGVEYVEQLGAQCGGKLSVRRLSGDGWCWASR